MKLSNFSQISQNLSKNPSLLVVISKDDFEKKCILQLLPDSQEVLEGSTFTKEAFFEATQQSSLFRKKTYLIIKECQLLSKSALGSISKYVQNPRVDLCLVLFFSEAINDELLKKQIKEKGVLFSLLEEKPWDRKSRLVHEALSYLEKEGALVEVKLVQELVESFANDQTALRSELDKWISYLPKGKKLSREEALQLTYFERQETIWMVGEAIFKRERAQSYRFAIELYENSSLFPLLAGLRSQVNMAIEVLQIVRDHGPALVTKKFPYLQGALLEKKRALFQEYGLDAHYAAKLAIYQTELRAKQHPHQERMLLERLILQLTKV